jgi:hypothetical protein
MRKSTGAFNGSTAGRRGFSSRKANPLSIVGGAALAFVVLGCVWTLYNNVFGASIYPTITASGIEPAISPPQHTAAKRASTVALLTAAYTPEPASSTCSDRFPLAERTSEPAPQVTASVDIKADLPKIQNDLPLPPQSPAPAVRQVASIPVPARRPAEARVPQNKGPTAREIAQASKATAVATADSNKPTIFDKLFGRPQSTVLAYASPDGGVVSDGRETVDSAQPRYDRSTAVYDISAHTVYMPDGTKLEAHSGLGSMLDDPRHVRVKMRGATPPHIYDLEPREALFHGVPALRLKPVGGEGAIFGRTGLLAHTYMLGPDGDSNGCVSFKDYDAFLRAYRSQKVRRLVVVAKLD